MPPKLRHLITVYDLVLITRIAIKPRCAGLYAFVCAIGNPYQQSRNEYICGDDKHDQAGKHEYHDQVMQHCFRSFKHIGGPAVEAVAPRMCKALPPADAPIEDRQLCGLCQAW